MVCVLQSRAERFEMLLDLNAKEVEKAIRRNIQHLDCLERKKILRERYVDLDDTIYFTDSGITFPGNAIKVDGVWKQPVLEEIERQEEQAENQTDQLFGSNSRSLAHEKD